MNGEIARLLSQAGVTGEFGWKDIVIRQNFGMIPKPVTGADREALGIGFNLNVLSNGAPVFFAKCRPASEPELVRSTAIRCRLAGDRQDGLSVSPAAIASSARLTVQVSRHLPGSNLGEIVMRQSGEAYLGLVRTVLDGNAKLSRLAMSDPGLLERRPATLSLAETASRVLDDAAHVAALDESEHAAITKVAEAAGEMPSRPQHGDLWWSNLLMIDGRVWVLDFDSYGEIRVPLFDDVTFMLGTLGLRAGSLAAGVECLGSPDMEACALRALLVERAVADGLTSAQIDGVIVYYLAHMAADVNRRSGAKFAAPHADALRFAARHLASGKCLRPAP